MTQSSTDPISESASAQPSLPSNAQHGGAMQRFWEWISQANAMKAARSDAGKSSPTERLAVDQARALLDLGERVRDRIASVSADSADTTALVLFHRAGLTALAALQKPEQATKEAWLLQRQSLLDAGTLPEGTLTRADLLFPAELRLDPSLSTAQVKSDADLLHQVASSLLLGLEGSERALGLLRWLRFFRISALTVALGALALAAIVGVVKLTAPHDLLGGKLPETSSVFPTDLNAAGILFHTNHEANPWVRFDLGEVKTVREIQVRNRAEVRDRAVPLVVEVSLDNKKWTEVARRTEEFERWQASFTPVSARYVKLTTHKTTFLHLASVKAH